jgi:hypothetical protein
MYKFVYTYTFFFFYNGIEDRTQDLSILSKFLTTKSNSLAFTYLSIHYLFYEHIYGVESLYTLSEFL